MYQTLKPLRDPRLDQAEMLCQLIIDIRRILIHPDLQNWVKLRAISEAVDELAPPPPPSLQPLADPMLWLWIDNPDVLAAILGDYRRREHSGSDQYDEDEPGYDHDTEHARRDE